MSGPVVIGATGGSGTRVVARMVRESGVHLGTDLNPAEDLLPMAALLDRWIDRWLGDPGGSAAQMTAELRALLREHARGAGRWGWKEPRSIIVLPLLAEALPGLRFVHVVRDGRDMAFSRNQNQLRKHGRAALGDDGPLAPHRSIALWAQINTGAAAFAERALGERYLRVRFEDVCADPDAAAATLAAFCGGPPPAPGRWRDEVAPPASIGRWRAQPPAIAAEVEAIGAEALARFGYAAAPGRPASVA